MKIFGDTQSGNCMKVRYTADFLGLSYAWEHVDILEGQSRTPEFLAVNPRGQVPAVQWSDGRTLAQSNAIIRYLAVGSDLLPADPFAQGKVDEWLFWEQYSHEPYIAVCRFHMHYLKKTKASREPARVERGESALDAMEQALAGQSWLANNSFSVADIALYAYTHLAHQGGFELTSRPNVMGWIDRCANQLASSNSN